MLLLLCGVVFDDAAKIKVAIGQYQHRGFVESNGPCENIYGIMLPPRHSKMGLQIHVLFKLIAVVLLNTLGVFGQPSVQSWNAVISSRYSRRTTSNKLCVFPFNVGDKYYSDCFYRNGETQSVCCTSILGGNCTEDSLEVCEDNRQTNSYLPAFVTVTGSYTVDPIGEVNGTYVLLNLQYDTENPSPLYQQITGDSHSSGFFFSFTKTIGSWIFFADWRRGEEQVLRSDVRRQKSDLLP